VNSIIDIPAKLAGWLLAIIGAFLLLMPVYGQHPAVQKIRVTVPAGEPVFTESLQDRNGYIWLGSDKGLFRFDGISFKQYYPETDTGDFKVTAIHEDLDGILWIGCKDGRIYRLVQGSVSLFNPEEGTAGTAVSDIVTDMDGRLWWSTTGEGIYYYSDGKVFNINHDDGLNDDYVYDLECDHTGLVWAGTDAGMAVCSAEMGKKTVEPLNRDITLSDIIVKVIHEDDKRRLWLGFQDGGTGYLSPGREMFVSASPLTGWPYGPVQDIVTPGGSIWAASASGDLLEINPDRQFDEISLVKTGNERLGKINDLLRDREGNVWILANSGFYRTTGTRFKFLGQADDLTLDNIHAIRNDHADPDRLWISNEGGLFLLNLQDGNAKKYLENFRMPDLKIMCLYQDLHGYIWAGTFNYGVFRIRPDDGSWIRVTEDQGLVNNNVLSISGHDDTLWMATLGGASEIILKENKSGNPFTISSHNRETGLVSNFIYAVYEDARDQIWFATDGDGISVLTKRGWITYDESDGLTDDVIYAITGDKYGNIWIASASKGIFKYYDEKFTPYGIGEGLSSLDITGIVTDNEEVLIVNDNGLDILHIPSGQVAHYSGEMGLSGISPDLNVIHRDTFGNTWIGTRKGIICYRPEPYMITYGPQTVIEDMSVYLEPATMDSDLTLGYNRNHISFKYTGLWFSNPEKVSYQVMLEGYDLGWKDTYDRQVTYSSLPPGKYTFRVRSSLEQSFRNASEVSYGFRIRGPFWASAWFIILTIIIVSIIAYFIIRNREKRFRRIEQQKKEKVEFEFQVLKNQVNPHFLFNSFSTLMALIEDKPDQALQYTEKLSDFFRTILQYKDQEVIKLEDEISLIESYFFLMKKRYGDNLHLDISLGKERKEKFIPPMTLQILIENSVKHNVISKDKPLFIRIFEEEGKIVVENNLQQKMTTEVSTGIGLENIRKRYRLITKVEPVIEKTDGMFRVKLPVIK
jgi:ligand-binding sensor domain-containing protein